MSPVQNIFLFQRNQKRMTDCSYILAEAFGEMDGNRLFILDETKIGLSTQLPELCEESQNRDLE